MNTRVISVVILFLIIPFFTAVSYAKDSRKSHKKQNSEIVKKNSAFQQDKQRSSTKDGLQEYPANTEQYADKLESMGDVTQTNSMRLQKQMDRRSKTLETLSNVLKKSSDTSKTITDNEK